jgi:ketosteroid isomerase-like protein
MSQENVEVVRQLFAIGVSQAEIFSDAALAELLDPEVELVTSHEGILAGRRYVGFEGFGRFWTDFYANWEGLSVEIQEYLDAGDQVVTFFRVRGRRDEVEIDAVWSAVFTLRNGRIIRIRSYASRAETLEAAGLSDG